MKSLVLLLLVIFCGTSQAGSRGYYVVAIDISGQALFESSTWKALVSGNVGQLPEATSCWQKGASAGEGITHITRKKIPAGLMELAERIWHGDRAAIESAQKILRSRDVFSRSEGYDGMYILNAKDQEVGLIAVGARGKVGSNNPSRVATLSWRDDMPEQTAAQLDLAMCQISKPLDVRFGV